MGISRIVCETNGDFGWKLHILPPPRAANVPAEGFPLKFSNGGSQKTRIVPHPRIKKVWQYVHSFKYNTTTRRTNGRTDGQTEIVHVKQYRAFSMRRTLKSSTLMRHLAISWCPLFTHGNFFFSTRKVLSTAHTSTNGKAMEIATLSSCYRDHIVPIHNPYHAENVPRLAGTGYPPKCHQNHIHYFLS